MLERARRIGAVMLGRLQAMAASHPCRRRRRGRGAMVAIELVGARRHHPRQGRHGPGGRRLPRAGAARPQAGTYGNVLRLLPPLVIPDDLLDEGLGILEAALSAA